MLLVGMVSILIVHMKNTGSLLKNTNNLWKQLNNITWNLDDHWAGQGYVFYENDNGEKKCIHQLYGSGLAAVGSDYQDFELIGTSTISIHGELFTYSGGKELVSASTTLVLAEYPTVAARIYNRTKLVDMKLVSAKNFDIKSLDK